MKSLTICLFFWCLLLRKCSNPSPLTNNNKVEHEELKGILDGLLNESTTSAPGIGSVAGLGQNIGNVGPLLIIGGFQAVITKFNMPGVPALIQDLPGLSGALPTGK